MSGIALFGLWHVYIVRAEQVRKGSQKTYKRMRSYWKRKRRLK